MEHNISEWNET